MLPFISVYFNKCTGVTVFLLCQTYGGDSWPIRIYRAYYNAKTSLEDMWQGNPVLTSVLFGLPLGFLSLICYSIWCSDILDADEEEGKIFVLVIGIF